MATHFRVERLSRRTRSGAVEELEFRGRLNLVVGPPNAGKTQWVRMLDYVFAESEPFLNRFPGENFTHYDRIAAVLLIGGRAFEVERFLHKEGKKTKVVVDEVPYDPEKFQEWLLEQLHIPLVRYPKGMSALEQTWPTLSFRTLYRHIYRQQRFWSDLADRQTPVETSACILQFLGLATEVYNEDLELLRTHRQLADRHSVEIYACRMAISILMGDASLETPSAEELDAIDPKAVISSLQAELGSLQQLGPLEAFDAVEETGLLHSQAKALLAQAQQFGRVSERLRLAQIFATRSQRAEVMLKDRQRDIWTLSQRIRSADLSDRIKDRTDFLCAAMNEYLDFMKDLDPTLWRHSKVQMRVQRPNDLRLYVGNIQWDRALGGTDSLLFLMAYHYGLLTLSAQDDCNYPGFVVVDFPAYFRGQSVAAIEGMIARPFAELMERDAFANCQVIFLGSSFEGERSGNRIALESRYLH